MMNAFSHHEPHQTHHRSLFLSDLHLGAFGSRADLVLRFLQRNSADSYVLVGDILDIWQAILPQWSWPHQEVIEHLRRRHAEGASIIYVRGNHDPDPATAPDAKRLPVRATRSAVHVAADGKRYLIVHGDGQDRRLLQLHILTRLGSRADQTLRRLDKWLEHFVTRSGPDRRSLIESGLSKVNGWLYLYRNHEHQLVAMAAAQGLDGVICGHFHMAALHEELGLVYANCGDWMDSFTALAEDFSGRLQILGGREAMAWALDWPAIAPQGEQQGAMQT